MIKLAEYYGVSTPTSDFIAHYGVTGMKWGVRKSRTKAFANAENKLKKVSRYNERGLTKKQQALENEWRKTQATEKEALARRNSFLGTFSRKRNREFQQARENNYKAADRFFKSMTPKQLERYHNRYLW